MTNEHKSDLISLTPIFLLWAMAVFLMVPIACATLRQAERGPCPPTELASLDARFAAEAIATCKAEHATADTCKALPGIRAKYAAERTAWVECKP